MSARPTKTPIGLWSVAMVLLPAVIAFSCGAPSTTKEEDDGNSTSTSTATGTNTGTSTDTSTGTGTNTDTSTNTGTGTDTDTGTDDGTGTESSACASPVLTGDEDEANAGFSKVTSFGKVYGWAVDKTDLAKQLNVEVYFDNKKDAGGTKVATAKASRSLEDGGHACNHGYFFSLLPAQCDGQNHDVFVYTDGGELLTPTALGARCFSVSTAGRNFFNANVADKFGPCLSCHPGPTYDGFFSSFLSSKGPNEGGTRTSNSLIDYPLGGNGHQGGNACGGLSGSPCAEFQQWWDVEFN